jgi:nitrate/TMAO reductase-like tetraheme cytochrome c subunit
MGFARFPVKGLLPEYSVRAFLKRLWGSRRWRWAIIAAVPAFPVLTVLSIELTSTSTFCSTCHIMKPFHETWGVSAHKDVACVECHIPPGLPNLISAKLNGLGQMVDNVLGRTSTHPRAVVGDASCMRNGCHEPAKVQALPRQEKPFFFDHAKHLDLTYQGIAVHCTTCHSHTTERKHFELNTGVCVTCHLLPAAPSDPRNREMAEATTAPVRTSAVADPASAETAAKPAPNRCRDCHQPPAEPIQYRGLKVVHAEYLAYGAACESCHRNVTAPAEPMGNERCYACHDFGKERMTSVSELHQVHTSAGRHRVECFNCHGLIRHGPDARATGLDQFDCRTCHRGQHQVQQQVYEFAGMTTSGAQPADGSPVTPMFMAHVDCAGCHVQPRTPHSKPDSGATVAAATAAACDNCHKPGLGEQMIPLWQKNTRSLYESVSRMLPDPAKPAASAQAGRLIAEARQLLALVRQDGSWGVHNPPYTQKLLELARTKILDASAAGSASGVTASTPP